MFSEAEIEAVALRVAELLRAQRTTDELVDASEIARRFGVSRDFVYEHAEELGAVRLGRGPKARMRFIPAEVEGRLRSRAEKPSTAPHRRRQAVRPKSLLPIRDRGQR